MNFIELRMPDVESQNGLMAMIQLREMIEAELLEYKTFLIEDCAKDVSRNYHIPFEEARSITARQINETLHQGLSTPNQFLYTIRLIEDASDVRIGYLWIDVNEAKKHCVLSDIFLEADFRGRGWGKKALQLLEARLAERDIEKVTLHVFADNPVARGLYEKMGYEVTGVNMQKILKG
jgi:ribosomal protein S18 acetylase RimI-like enzyme